MSRRHRASSPGMTGNDRRSSEVRRMLALQLLIPGAMSEVRNQRAEMAARRLKRRHRKRLGLSIWTCKCGRRFKRAFGVRCPLCGDKPE